MTHLKTSFNVNASENFGLETQHVGKQCNPLGLGSWRKPDSRKALELLFSANRSSTFWAESELIE
jgi:hypothetical protein